MKLRYNLSLGCLLLSLSAAAQVPGGTSRPSAIAAPVPAAYNNTSINLIRKWQANAPGTDTGFVISPSRTPGEITMLTNYMDGLGRPLQTVARGISSLGNDLVSPHVYDSFGREHFRYMPYIQQSANTNDGKFKTDPFNAQKAFFQNTTLNPDMAGEAIYYSQVDFENSPYSRELNVYAPGNSWAKEGGNRPIKKQYYANDVTDSVRIWKLINGIPVNSGIYPKGTLYKTVSIDEQNNQLVEYTDKDQQVILRKQLTQSTYTAHGGWACTYYVYDDLGNPVVVMPPLAVERAMIAGWDASGVMDELCYQYQYDERRRLVVKKLPGAAPLYKVYDVRDRLVFSQDGNQRAKSPQEWLATFYDGQDRPTMTAIYKSNSSREVLQNSLKNSVGSSQDISYTFPLIADLFVNSYDGSSNYKASNSITLGPGFEGTEFTAEIDLISNNGTSVITATNPLPALSASDLYPLSYTYYDNYGYAGQLAYESADFSKPQAGSNPYAETLPGTPFNTTIGLVTGTKVRVLGTNQWITTSFYFDRKGREIQRVAENQPGGKDVLTSLYDFSGKVLSTYLRTRNPRSSLTPQTTTLTMLSYDQAAHLSSVTKRINDEATKDRVILANTYNEQGQLQCKRLDVSGSTTQLDTLTYSYNIRGWLQGINKAYVNSTATSNWFGEELNYDYGFSTALYNGNISGVKWKAGSDNIARAYGYSYDKINRLVNADFRQSTDGQTWTNNSMDFTVSNLSYDANGNIQSMKQMGLIGTASSTIDQLSYTYKTGSNKLESVTDAVNTTTAKLGDFNNGTNTGNDYTYDNNGNTITDLNRGISSISFNHLNLPEKVVIDNKGSITYLYDAAGNKLQKTVVDNTLSPAVTTVTDYVGGSIFIGDTLQQIAHEEGRIRFTYDSTGPTYTYDYFEKDHLGNTRVVLGTTTQSNVYAATMETAGSAKENALFSNIDATRTALPAAYPADATTNPNAYVAKLNGVNGNKIGPSLVLRVMAGDKIQLGVKAFYKSTAANTSGSTTESMVSALAQAFTGSSALDAAHGVTAAGTSGTPLLTTTEYNNLKQKDPSQNLTDKPKAYLNYVMVNDQFKLVNENSGIKQVQGSPDQLQSLAVSEFVVKQTGFLYIYTSNESAENVYFDNLVVVHNAGGLMEVNHYYPYGLTMAGISSNMMNNTYKENKYKFNGVQLENKEFSDGSGLEMYDMFYRKMDPQIGRWWQIDPRPDERFSPYAAMACNPVKFADPMGDTTWLFSSQGNYLGVIYDDLPNEVHFLNVPSTTKPMAKPYFYNKQVANFVGRRMREISVAFMGAKSAASLKAIEAFSESKNKEIAFVGKVDANKEIIFTPLPIDESNKMDEVNGEAQIDKKYSKEEQIGLFMFGHVHGHAAEGSMRKPDPDEQRMWLGEPSREEGADFHPALYREGSGDQKGQSPAIIVTPYGVTIYGTGTYSFTETFHRPYFDPRTWNPPPAESYLLFGTMKGKHPVDPGKSNVTISPGLK
ncbi:DUF6443 domain-containing protein [Chitinophaga silvisoli]|uniref:DUF6443 domain-containing protein n=1 Tax=Chitinophaga silvisoli TaxID=2291814 RepID=A0A3E1NYX0_9BACT|nr:DUF6443 domain-containing protein [Chitinophaga silvisoli]RFM33054.1 hypothetical protein DXN04_21740 [Chitinophaga silvisoli]